MSDQTDLVQRTVEALARDTRHSLRRLMRDWRFTTAAVLILGLGIGANSAIFSLINAVLFRHAPLAEPDRLVDIYQTAANPGGMDASSHPAYLDMSEYTDVFASTTAALVPLGVNYQHEGSLRHAVVEHTTATYLSVLGLRPSLGRWFSAAEDTRGAEVVAVLGHQAWMRTFGGDPSVIGRTLRIEGVPVAIVGVGPAGYNGTINIGIVTDFWLPISSLPVLGASPRALERRPDEAGFFVKARLRDGVSVAQAQSAMDILGRRLASEYPNEDPGKGIRVIASKDVRIHPQADGPVTAIASIVLVIVGLVLAIACSNLATLLLVRGALRAKEMSVRLAIGASRRQLVRQLLTESLLLSLAGGVAGSIVAWWGIRSLRAVDLPISVDLTLDVSVLAFAIAVSFITGIACGLAPKRHHLCNQAGDREAGDREQRAKAAGVVQKLHHQHAAAGEQQEQCAEAKLKVQVVGLADGRQARGEIVIRGARHAGLSHLDTTHIRLQNLFHVHDCLLRLRRTMNTASW